MAKIIGTSSLIDAWASGGAREDSGISKSILGWLTTERPPSQWFNFKMHQTDSKLNHVMSNGVSLWNSTTTYTAGACVTHIAIQWRAVNTSANSTPSLANADWVALATILDVERSLPIGCGVWTYNQSATSGWVFFQGQAISRATYPQLFLALGTSSGAGNGSSTFNLPDERGEFFRGFSGSSGIDAGRILGTKQTQDIQAHTHGLVPLFVGGDSDRGGSPSAFSIDSVGETGSTGGLETRPRNIAGRYMYRLG